MFTAAVAATRLLLLERTLLVRFNVAVLMLIVVLAREPLSCRVRVPPMILVEPL